MAARLKAKHPDAEYADDEALYSQIYDDYDQYDQELEQRRDSDQKLRNMLDTDPRAAALLLDIANGKGIMGFIGRFGPEFRELLDDPDKQEELAKEQNDYLEKVTKEKELEEEYNKNLPQSLKLLEDFQKENGLSDEQADQLLDAILKVGNDMIMGKFEQSTIEMCAKALRYDNDIAEAQAKGEVRGRNANIEEKLRKGSLSDGVPSLSGANNSPSRQRQSSIFELAADAQR